MSLKDKLDQNEEEVMMIHQAKIAASGEMIANIAHQWRQPLNSLALILANLEDAYKYDELDENYFKTSIERAKNLIMQMSSTIDDFRYFFNPVNDKEEFSPYQSIRSILYLLEENLRFNNISIIIPESEIDTMVYGCKGQYSQALFNIISNSIDALSDHDIKDRRIEIYNYQEAGNFICEIEDNAGGIDEGIIGRIYEMYFTTKPGKKGTGLGLYIAKNIIENNLKGSIVSKNSKAGLMTVISIPMESEEDSIE